MKKVVGFLICFLLVGCREFNKIVIRGPSPGIEYHNQLTAPWPWVHVVPTERALELKTIDLELLTRHLRFSLAFEPYREAFQDVRLVIMDYTILPSVAENEKSKEQHKAKGRPRRYFMVLSFYKIGRKPPCPPDFEVTASMRIDKAGRNEAYHYMAHQIVQDIRTLSESGFLTPGKKITVNLD